jgi:glycosyltransferase involved in cell wall biosynthesis
VVAPIAPGLGGQGAAAGDIAEGLRTVGLDVEYVYPPGPGPARHLAARRPLRRFKALGRALDRRAVARVRVPSVDLTYAMPGFLPEPGRGGIRVLHQATHHPRRVMAAMVAARAEAGGGMGFMTRGEMRRLEAEVARADLVRVESQTVADELAEEGIPGQRLVVAYPGVDLERFAPGRRPERLRVAFVGVLSLWKGVDVVVRLAREIIPVGEVVVVGGPVCAWSRRITSDAPLEQHDGDVPSLLASSHALVLPSASDGFGYVVLEAMASGAVPFVSPEVGAAELVRDLDIRLVQPRATFARVVPKLLRSLPLEELGAQARVLAKRYERTAMAKNAASLLLERVEHVA